jgi:hypothetical protein
MFLSEGRGWSRDCVKDSWKEWRKLDVLELVVVKV